MRSLRTLLATRLPGTPAPSPAGGVTPRALLACAALALLASAACTSTKESAGASGDGGGSPSHLDSLEPLDVPEGAIALYTPIIPDIPSGGDQMYCTYTDFITEEPLFVHKAAGAQSRYGHHTILLYTSTAEEPRTEECTGQGMEKFNQLIGGAGAEGGLDWEPPERVGVMLPKGAQFVIQTHWINTGTEASDVEAMMVAYPGVSGPDRIEVGTVAIVNTAFKIPTSQRYSETTDCVFDVDHRMLMTLGHEHQWGTHVSAQVVRKDGTTESLLDRTFHPPEDIFNPPVTGYPEATPLSFQAGDTVKFTCEWENDTTDVLGFPREMCVFFGYSYEPGDARCLNGAWAHSVGTGGPDAGAPIECVAKDAPGNELGVGEHCTKGGGECANNTGATICAADFGGPAACTIPCSSNADCGTAAVCVGSSPTDAAKGCMPFSCAPDWALGDAGAGG